MNHTQTLVAAGLTYQQATIYELLLKNGPQKAGPLSKIAPLKRGLVYKTLDELVELKIVEKDDSTKISFFTPKHPSALSDLAIRKEEQARTAKKALDGALGSLVSEFNLISGKPGVQFFEGEEGVRTVLEDSLANKRMVYTYADIEAVVKNINHINTEHVKKREHLGIKKQALILDTPFARDHMKTYYTDVTETRLLSNKDAPPFHSVMEIYDGKVSYITFEKNTMVGVIITDRAIYEMHKYLFENLWSKTQRVTQQL